MSSIMSISHLFKLLRHNTLTSLVILFVYYSDVSESLSFSLFSESESPLFESPLPISGSGSGLSPGSGMTIGSIGSGGSGLGSGSGSSSGSIIIGSGSGLLPLSLLLSAH